MGVNGLSDTNVDVGLATAAEKVDVVSSEGGLLDKTWCKSGPKSCVSSVLILNWLWVGDKGEGVAKPVGDVGESTLGDCTPDAKAELMLRREGLPESLLEAKEPLRDFAPNRPFLCLNLSNQAVLSTFSFPSGLPHVFAKKMAFSRIISSLRG